MNIVDDSFVDELKHVLQTCSCSCFIQQLQHANSFPTLVSVDKCLSEFFLIVDDFLNL